MPTRASRKGRTGKVSRVRAGAKAGSRVRGGRVLKGSHAPQEAIELMREVYAEAYDLAEKACLTAIDYRGDGLEIRLDSWVERAVPLFEKYLSESWMKGLFVKIQRATLTIRDSVDDSLKQVPTIKAHRYLNAGNRRLTEFQTTNLNLIKSVGPRTVNRLKGIINTNPDLHSSELRQDIQKSLGVSKRKADLWARDQTLKLHADVAEAKHESLGITEYIWRTSDDERVRDDPKYGDHASLNGNTYKYSNPPIVALKGLRKCNPGKDYECRCTADPILPD